MSDEQPDRADTHLFVALVLTGLVVFAVAVGVGVVLGANPGSLADWVAAVSTFAALLAAAYAAVQTRRTFGLEQGRDAERVEQTRRAQAVQVAVWPGRLYWEGPLVTTNFTGDNPSPQVTRSPGVVRPTSIPVTVHNASPVPVWHLYVEVWFSGMSAGSAMTLAAAFKVMGEADGIAVMGRTSGIEIATPELVGDMVRVLEMIPGADEAPVNAGIGWSFQDNAGQWWRRHPSGRLEPLDKPPHLPKLAWLVGAGHPEST